MPCGDHQTAPAGPMEGMETITLDRRPSDRSDRSGDRRSVGRAPDRAPGGPAGSGLLADPPPPLVPLLLTEVAAHLRCTRRSVERQVAGGHLHVVHIGRAVRVERRELDRYLAALRDLEVVGGIGGSGGSRAGGGDAG